MKFSYETDRLILKILDGSNANDILRFYLANRELFELCEAARPENFYTEAYQRRILNHEFQMCIKQTGVHGITAMPPKRFSNVSISLFMK